MGCCSGGARYAEAERQFGPAVADRDVERYRRKGPDATSRLLLDAVRARKSGLLAGVAALSTKSVKLATGYRLEFPATLDVDVSVGDSQQSFSGSPARPS
jgi:hypothetical protein